MVKEPESDGLELFYILWPLAIFFHFEWAYLNASHPPAFAQLVIIVTAPLVIATLRRDIFLVMIVAQLIDCYQIQPRCPNHWQLVALVNIAYLLSRCCSLVMQFPFVTLFHRSITWLTIAFYGITTLWKLTTDFLNPTTSCAVIFLREIPIFGSLIPEELLSTIPLLTIFIEGLIGVLLAIHRLRSALITGLLFHFSLSLNLARKFINFSAVMYALLTSICCSKSLYSKSLFYRPIYRILLALHLPIILIWTTTSSSPNVVYLTMRFGVLGLIAAYLVYLALCNREDADDLLLPPLPAAAWFISAIPAALLLIIGIFPILGIRNSSAWQMYGNLKLTAEQSNHLFIPRSLNVLGIQDNEVEITYYDDRTIRKELLSVAQECLSIDCHKRIKRIKDKNGIEISIDSVMAKSKGLSWFEEKVMRLRTAEEMQGCQW